MRQKSISALLILSAALALTGSLDGAEKRLLYVAVPGVRNYAEYGGDGILVYDIDRDHTLVKRIASTWTKDKPEAVKGICASAATRRVYFSTPKRLICLDLLTEKVLWEKAYAEGFDRMSISPDGKIIYQPSFEKAHWYVIDAASGDVITKVTTNSGSHNTVYGADGTRAYLAGLKSNLLTVADTKTHTALMTVGPFGGSVRPFTVNGGQTLCYATVNALLGFEIGDLGTGKVLHRVEVAGFEKGPVKRHGCPSHGIGLTPDEKEVWVCDAFNQRLHVFDNTVMPPKPGANIKLRDEPGWVTFSIDGRFAYPSTGEVVDTKTRKIVAQLKDENGNPVQSEKLLEIDFADDIPSRTGDQFGVGRVRQ